MPGSKKDPIYNRSSSTPPESGLLSASLSRRSKSHRNRSTTAPHSLAPNIEITIQTPSPEMARKHGNLLRRNSASYPKLSNSPTDDIGKNQLYPPNLLRRSLPDTFDQSMTSDKDGLKTVNRLCLHLMDALDVESTSSAPETSRTPSPMASPITSPRTIKKKFLSFRSLSPRMSPASVRHSKSVKESSKSLRLSPMKATEHFRPENLTADFAVLDRYLVRDVDFEVQRIPQYDKYLSELLAETDESHPDYEDLTKAAQKVAKMVKERADEVNCMENENKVDSVQERFPNDDLQLNDKDKHTRPKSLHMRRRSAPTAVLLKTFNTKSRNSIIAGSGIGNAVTAESPVSENRAGSHANRVYVLEGPVQLTAGLQSQDRYLFLFNDLLLVAKQKSSTTFKLKSRIRVCELWLATCLEDVSETTRDKDRSFVLGWPTLNMVATFSSTDLKELWYSKLKNQISLEKDKERSKTLPLKITNKDMESYHMSKSLLIRNDEAACEILKRCVDEFKISESEGKDYQLWVVAGKDETPYPLIGHEHPYSIRMNHVRNMAKTDSDDLVIPMDMEAMDTSADRPQFVLCHSKKMSSKHAADESSTKRKKSKKSPIINLFKRSNTHKEESNPSSPSLGKLFGHCLSDVCEDDNIPKAIMDMLQFLFVQGPYTPGIFRKSANARVCKEIRAQLDLGFEQNYEEVSVLVVGAVFKDFLRSLPDTLLQSDLYDQWMDTLEIQDNRERVEKIKKTMENLSKCQHQLLRYVMCILYHIDKKNSENNMNAYNLAVCMAPNLIKPPNETQQADFSTKMPRFIQFMIEHVTEIFGEQTVMLFGEPVTPKARQDSSTDSDSMHSLSGLHDHPGMLRRDDSSLDSLERELYSGDMDSSPRLLKSELSPTNLSRDSGLTLSDSQLDNDENENEMLGHSDRRKILMRSNSQFDQVPENGNNKDKLSRSYPENRSKPMAPPVPPPRRNRRRGSEPPLTQEEMRRRMMHHGVPMDSERAPLMRHTSLTNNMSIDQIKHIREMAANNRVSADSLDSVEEDAEPAELREDFTQLLRSNFHSQDIGVLRKSASGARLYMNDQLLHSRHGPDDRRILERNGSSMSQDSTPPVSPYSNNSLDMSNDSLESNKAFSPTSLAYHDSLRQTRSPLSPDSYILRRNQSGSKYTNSPTRKSDPLRATYPGPTEVPMETDTTTSSQSYHGNTLKEQKDRMKAPSPSDYASTQSLGDQESIFASPMKDMHPVHPSSVSSSSSSSVHGVHHGSVQSLSSHSSQESTGSSPRNSVTKNAINNNVNYPVQSSSPGPMQVSKPKQRPLTVSGSLDYSMNDPATLKRARAGMTARGADFFPAYAIKTIFKRNLQGQESGSNSNENSPRHQVEKRGSCNTQTNRPQSADCINYYNNEIPTSQGNRQHTVNDSNVNRLLMKDIQHRNNECPSPSNSTSSAGSSEHQRPSQPPSYQEAIKRKSLIMNNNKPCEISNEDRIKQTVISARARELYQESMKKYQNEQSDPSCRDTEPQVKKRPLRPQLDRALRKKSDTQLEKSRNTQYNENQRDFDVYEDTKRGANLQRSKSDSSEHINRLGHLRKMTAATVQENPARRTLQKQYNFDSGDIWDSYNSNVDLCDGIVRQQQSMRYQPHSNDKVRHSINSTSLNTHRRPVPPPSDNFNGSSPKKSTNRNTAVYYDEDVRCSTRDFSHRHSSNSPVNNQLPPYRTPNSAKSLPENSQRNSRRDGAEVTYV